MADLNPRASQCIVDDKAARRIQEIKRLERQKRDQEADQYVDFVESQYGPFRSKAYTEVVLHHLRLNKHEIWLDAGSGVGRLSLEIAPKIETLVCTDHSLESLRRLRKKAETRKSANFHIFQCDICHLTFKASIFDGVLCNEVLQHIPSHAERLRAASNMYNVLRPGGRCVVNVIRWQNSQREKKEGYWGKNHEIYRYYFMQAEIKDLMKEAGFSRISVRGLDVLHPRVSRVLPLSWTFLERWLSLWPLSASVGANLLAIGVK